MFGLQSLMPAGLTCLAPDCATGFSCGVSLRLLASEDRMGVPAQSLWPSQHSARDLEDIATNSPQLRPSQLGQTNALSIITTA